MAYVAGRDLSRAQVTLINILFAFTSAFFLDGAVSSFGKQLNIANQLRVINPGNFYPMTTVTVPIAMGNHAVLPGRRRCLVSVLGQE